MRILHIQINVNDFSAGLFINGNEQNTIENLFNVNITNPQDGDLLIYDGTILDQ